MCAVGSRKSPFPTTVAIGLYNCLYYRTSRDGGHEAKHCVPSATHRHGWQNSWHVIGLLCELKAQAAVTLIYTRLKELHRPTYAHPDRQTNNEQTEGGSK